MRRIKEHRTEAKITSMTNGRNEITSGMVHKCLYIRHAHNKANKRKKDVIAIMTIVTA